MWRNMDDRLERRRELLIPGGGLDLEEDGEANLGGWRGEGNTFPRLMLPKLVNVGKSSYRKGFNQSVVMIIDHHGHHYDQWPSPHLVETKKTNR